MSSDRDNRIKSIQSVSALTFLGIFTFHTKLTQMGAWGVSVFFVLSGYMMAYIC